MDDVTGPVLKGLQELRPLLYDVVTDYGDYNGDSFYDVLDEYIRWRKRGRQPRSYFVRLMRKWELGQWIPEFPDRTVKQMIESGDTRLLTNDDAAICAALAQAVVDGKVLPGLLKKALVALRRQRKEFVLASRGYSDPRDVEEVLTEIEAQLQRR